MYSGRKACAEAFSVGLPQHHRSKSDLKRGFTLGWLSLDDNNSLPWAIPCWGSAVIYLTNTTGCLAWVNTR